MNRQTALIFYVLSAYVVVQFIWWGYHLIELTQELNKESSLIGKRVTMIMGEGAVFLLLLLVGIWQIRRSIKKELRLSQRQKNFLLSVTHELKTPLAANKLYIQTVSKRDLKPEQQKELLDKAIEENSRLERMIDNILNASRLENKALAPNIEKISLNQIASSVIDRFKSMNNTLEIKLAMSDELEVDGDRFMMESIFSNLIENAIKYAGKGGPITVYGHKKDNRCIFGVKDSGSGVSKEHRQEVFKKFFRTGDEQTRAQKGSGLGLYIVDQLVQVQGGSVSCIEAENGGANFEIIMSYG